MTNISSFRAACLLGVLITVATVLVDQAESVRLVGKMGRGLSPDQISSKIADPPSVCRCKMICLLNTTCTAVTVVNFKGTPEVCTFSDLELSKDNITTAWDGDTVTFLKLSDKQEKNRDRLAQATDTEEESAASSARETAAPLETAASTTVTSGSTVVTPTSTTMTAAATTMINADPTTVEDSTNSSTTTMMESSDTSTDTTASPPPCLSPFGQLLNVGCIVFLQYPLRWFDARSSCKSYGADLYVAKEPKNFVSLADYIRDTNYKEELWMGIRDRIWLNKRSVDDSELSDDFVSSNETMSLCGAAFGDNGHNGVFEDHCGAERNSLCQMNS